MVKRTKYKKVHKGDIFQFGDAKIGYGYGVILISETLIYVGIFDRVFGCEVSDTKLLDTMPLLLSGSTADGRIQSGAWKIVGNMKNVPHFDRPNFKVGRDGEIWVVDFDRNFLRLATVDEIKTLNYKFSMSPVAYEKAFWAWHNDGEWEERFNKILIGN